MNFLFVQDFFYKKSLFELFIFYKSLKLKFNVKKYEKNSNS